MILQDWLPHARKSNYNTLVQISIGSTLWKSSMKNSMKSLHFTFAGLIANSGLLFVVWKKINATQLGFRCQTFWNHFRNALQTHEDLLRRCRRMKGLIFKEKNANKKKKWNDVFLSCWLMAQTWKVAWRVQNTSKFSYTETFLKNLRHQL